MAGKKTIKELCELEQIPSAFGYKILQKMNKSGLIEIRRGPKGGYQLAKDIGEFTLYDVVTAIEPDFAVMECVHHSCIRNESKEGCAVHRELLGIQHSVEKLLKKKTMADILKSSICVENDTQMTKVGCMPTFLSRSKKWTKNIH